MHRAPALKTANYSTNPMNTLSVLVLDDSEFDRTRMKRLIKQADRTVDVITCATLKDFQKALANHLVDVCLVDHQLQEASGLEAVAAVNQQMRTKNVPVIMISGREDTEVIVNSMRAGCVNYVGKNNLTAEKLHRVIFNSIADTFSSTALASEVHEATKNVIGGVAKGCMSELQPRLRRMYRQIEFIRTCHTKGLAPSPEALDEIEEHCLMIWRFFDEIEHYGENLGETRH